MGAGRDPDAGAGRAGNRQSPYPRPSQQPPGTAPLRIALACALLAAPAHAAPIHNATARVEDGGALADGRHVPAIVLRNGAISVRILAYGASLQSLIVPDRHGRRADI
ncbi:hypothetical protein KXV85_004609, partial [Aspergillus fumigatus]